MSVDPDELAYPGAHAATPARIPARGWRQIVARALHQGFLDRVTLISAGVAFFGFMALFPGLIAGVLLYGLVSTPADLADHVEALAGTLPPDAAAVVAGQMEVLVEADQRRLGIAAVASVLVALWSAFVGMDHLLVAVNVVYEETERSGFWRRRAHALLFTLRGGGRLRGPRWRSSRSSPPWWTTGFLLGPGRWLLVLTVFALSLGAIYRYGPDRRRARVSWVTVGALVATAFWLLASAGLSLYVAEFDRYARSYGALAGVVVLLVWMWLSCLAVLLGAEINAEAEHQTDADSTVGPPLPRGHRHAVKADDAVGRPPAAARGRAPAAPRPPGARRPVRPRRGTRPARRMTGPSPPGRCRGPVPRRASATSRTRRSRVGCGTSHAAGRGPGRRAPSVRSGLAARAALDVVGVRRLDPREHLAQLAAGGLDRVRLALRAQLLELRPPASWSAMNRSAKAPDWMSARTAFMFSFTCGSMTRGPET